MGSTVSGVGASSEIGDGVTEDEYTQPTPADEAEVKTLEALGDTRSSAESERLQDLYINRGVWRDIQRALARAGEAAKAVVVQPFKTLSGHGGSRRPREKQSSSESSEESWNKSKGLPLLIIPVVPSAKWNVIAVISLVPTLIAEMFTPSELTAIGMVIGLLTAIAANITSIIIARQSKAAATDAKTAIAENTKLTEKTSADVEKVKTDVDGMKSRDDFKIAERDRALVSKDQVINELKQQMAVLLAQQAPHTVVIAGPAAALTAPVVAGIPAEESLQQIDKHTAETATNTRRTEAKVDDLKGQS